MLLLITLIITHVLTLYCTLEFANVPLTEKLLKFNRNIAENTNRNILHEIAFKIADWLTLALIGMEFVELHLGYLVIVPVFFIGNTTFTIVTACAMVFKFIINHNRLNLDVKTIMILSAFMYAILFGFTVWLSLN